MRVVVVGAGLGGLAAAVRLQHLGHQVVLLEQGDVVGGKAGRAQLSADDRVWTFDTGPSLLTMPWVVQELLAETGLEPLELSRVEPVTRYRFADGSSFELSASREASLEALRAWRGDAAAAGWDRFLRICAAMWKASVPVLTGPPPWPPRRPAPDAPPPDPRDLLRVRPWHTLRSLARTCTSIPELQWVIERFATYAGADPRRAPAALAVAGWVEHAFGAWHVPGGLFGIVERLRDGFLARGGELRLSSPVIGVLRQGAHHGASGVRLLDGSTVSGDVVVFDGDARRLRGMLRGGARPSRRDASVSGLALMLALDGTTSGRVHHEITFPAAYDAELADLWDAPRPVRDPTLYVSAPDDAGPAGGEGWFVLANAPAGLSGIDWEAEADRIVARLGVADRVVARRLRTPVDLEQETGAVGGAIYGAAPHGRLGTLGRPGHRVRGVANLWQVGGTAHPGGGIPLVLLSGALVARELGPA